MLLNTRNKSIANGSLIVPCVKLQLKSFLKSVEINLKRLENA